MELDQIVMAFDGIGGHDNRMIKCPTAVVLMDQDTGCTFVPNTGNNGADY